MREGKEARGAYVTATCLFAALVLVLGLSGGSAWAGETAVAAWSRIPPPPPPALEDAAPPQGRTALLILDMQPQTCNAERRPRCLDTVAAVAGLAEKARQKGVPVIYSLIRGGKPEDIFESLRRRAEDPVVATSVDKFLGTDMEKILRDKGVTTVVVTGTAAHGAVLHTATGAAQRGFSVIVPVDGISAEDLYTEAAALWCLATGPASRGKTVLTACERISF
ncbi:isochorismatase family protein [Desulfolutivibrio sulfoxidireducens]|uniref:isochorismatase family protein n=1 Tax=Desulfolutivibrio sulfoxidireducens TaxID=2773299 RepID=UPI00159E7341|nr:isochorismatase family protein [Desulfolutivibrio sulfoxidireducens]QLA15399.1 isochorismatase family protein [Desulfolutivibrio sulfoxidireducens]QLA18995.1 isochorismatase family protein [Desulfolutivibrio sulfoxidireducens]